jgi:hypothetical protein
VITMTASVSFFAIRDPAIERNDLITPLILIYPVNTLLLFMNFSLCFQEGWHLLMIVVVQYRRNKLTTHTFLVM